jgi:hypothetical protein
VDAVIYKLVDVKDSEDVVLVRARFSSRIRGGVGKLRPRVA